MTGVCKEDNITELLTDNSFELLFLEDEFLMARSISTKEYKDYSILKTSFSINLFEKINNTVTIKNLLEDQLEEREAVAAN